MPAPFDPTMTPSLLATIAFWFALLLVSLPEYFAQLHIPRGHVQHHPDLGFSVVLPLSRHPLNHTLARREIGQLSRRLSRRGLSDDSQPNARMTLYDDLLTKGYYTSRLWIGSPPQEFALIVDTGSTVTYVPCESCTQCGNHQDPRFNPEASSTYKPEGCGPQCSSCDMDKQQCKYERRYAEQSTSQGLLGNDLISFGNDTGLVPKRLVFGCETAETGDIYDQKADGIMGLGRGPLSIVDQLVANNAITASFSLCYGGMDEGGGAMIMGSIPNPPDMVFTHSDFSRSVYYNLALEEVFVGGKQLPVDRGIFDSSFGTVLDSGTTYAYFPKKVFEAFKTSLMEHVKLHQVPGPDSHYPDICFQGAGSDLSKLSDHFPEVQLKFGDGQIVSLAPENYLFKHLKVHGGYCLGIFGNGKDSATLLGGIVVRNMLVTYDRVHQQIGFWRTNCSDLWNNLQASLNQPPGSPNTPPSLAPVKSLEPSTAPGPACVSGNVDVNLYLNMNYTAFVGSTEKFLEDLSHDVDIDVSQVSLIDFRTVGQKLSVTFAIHLAATNEPLLNAKAAEIVARLNNHGVHVRDAFGTYEVATWKMTLVSKRSTSEVRTGVLILAAAGFVLVLFVGVASLIWWYSRSKAPKYLTVQQSVEMSDQT